MRPDQATIVRRAALELASIARELGDTMVANLGIGLPTLIPGVLPAGMDVVFHSENGFVGMGPPLLGGTPDHPVIDAGGRACTLMPGAACFDSVLSFAVVRGGHLDVAVLGAFEVSEVGDLANWMIPGKLTPGMGGAMELAQKANRVVVVSTFADKKGNPKLVPRCTLPLTAAGCVDTLITERALFRRRDGRMTLCSTPPGEDPAAVLAALRADIPAAGEPEPWA